VRRVSPFLLRILALSVLPVVAGGRAAAADPSLLEIRVVEGDGASYVIGSRATRGVTVLVTDETGKPVDGAIVSYLLPSNGPGGTFTSGTRTEVLSTKADGRAVVWGMQWNNTPGPVEMRITAVKGAARAGTITTLYLTNPDVSAHLSPAETAPAGKTKVTYGRHKWIWVTLAVAGAAVVGAAIAGGIGSPASATPSAAAGVQIGAPTISLGRP
jgi:hypothetical protein